MVQKIALLAGGLGAAAVLAFALGLTNFVFAGPGATKQTADTQPAAQAAGNQPNAGNQSNAGNGQGAQQQTRKVVDKVYIAPTTAPKSNSSTANTAPAQNTAPKQNNKPAAPAWHESDHSAGHNGGGRGDD